MAKAPKTEGEEKAKRAHRATFSKDKLKGGFSVRIEGPTPNRFGGREVPVTLKDGTEKMTMLGEVRWTGKDKESGKPVAIYDMVKPPKEEGEEDEITF